MKNGKALLIKIESPFIVKKCFYKIVDDEVLLYLNNNWKNVKVIKEGTIEIYSKKYYLILDADKVTQETITDKFLRALEFDKTW